MQERGLERFAGGKVRPWLLMVSVLVACGAARMLPALPAGWNPEAFAKEDTLKLRTIEPQEGEHWSTVWLVVIDNQVYVRLGTRAAGRVEHNTTAPHLGVDVGGQRFERVRGVPAPESAQRVGAAMAGKYWSDVLVRHMNHPLTLRLVPEN